MKNLNHVFFAFVSILGFQPMSASAGMPVPTLVEKMGRAIGETMTLKERIDARAGMPMTAIRSLDKNYASWSIDDKVYGRLTEIRFQLPQGSDGLDLDLQEKTHPVSRITFEKGARAQTIDPMARDYAIPSEDRVQCGLTPAFEPMRNVPEKAVLKSRSTFNEFPVDASAYRYPMPIELAISFIKGSEFASLRCVKFPSKESKESTITVRDVEKAFGDYVFFVEVPDDVFYRYLGYKWISKKYEGQNIIDVLNMLSEIGKTISSRSKFSYKDGNVSIDSN